MIIQLYNDGVSQWDIEDQMGRSLQAVRCVLKKALEDGEIKYRKRPAKTGWTKPTAAVHNKDIKKKPKKVEHVAVNGITCNKEVSKTCKYGSGNPDYLCDYVLIEHKARPCQGWDCTCYVKCENHKERSFGYGK